MTFGVKPNPVIVVQSLFSFRNYVTIPQGEESINSITIVHRDSNIIEITFYKGRRKCARRWLHLHEAFRYLAIRDSADMI